MELSKRLNTIAKLVEKCEVCADIGTDHAYIPIHLTQNNICKKVIASDINKGPVLKAMKNIKLEGLESVIECRLGPGLSTLKPKEANVVIIAGMGGYMIRDILEDDIEIFKNLEYAILQPVQNADILRKYIYDKGYNIITEELCKEGNKYYEIIKINYDNKFEKVDEIYYEVSKNLLQKNSSLIKEFITYKVFNYCKIYDNIKEETVDALKRKRELKEKITKLKELL